MNRTALTRTEQQHKARYSHPFSSRSSAPLHPRGSSYSISSRFSRLFGGSGACTLSLTDIGCSGSTSFVDLQTRRRFLQGGFCDSASISLVAAREVDCVVALFRRAGPRDVALRGQPPLQPRHHISSSERWELSARSQKVQQASSSARSAARLMCVLGLSVSQFAPKPRRELGLAWVHRQTRPPGRPHFPHTHELM